MKKYKQGYADRQDERYGMEKKAKMGHEKAPKKCDPFQAQKSDMGRLKKEPSNHRGYPAQAFGYKY